MSDDEEDIPLDLTQRIEVDRAPTGGILAGVVGKDRVFVCRSGSRLKAYSAQCPHLGGPLDKGIVTAGTIRCPWHHACFDLATGEATAAPAFDALARVSGCVRQQFLLRGGAQRGDTATYETA